MPTSSQNQECLSVLFSQCFKILGNMELSQIKVISTADKQSTVTRFVTTRIFRGSTLHCDLRRQVLLGLYMHVSQHADLSSMMTNNCDYP